MTNEKEAYMSGFADRVAYILCAAGICGAAMGCFERKDRRMDDSVYYKGTPAYEQKIAAFTITEEQAFTMAYEFRRVKKGYPPGKWVFVGRHDIIVGDSYVFAAPDKLGYLLRGIYVNGKTGEVSECKSKERVPPP